MGSFDVLDFIMDHLGIPTLMIYRQVAKSVYLEVQSYIQRRLYAVLTHVGIPPAAMLQLLRESHAVISGSTVLHFMLPRDQRTWVPKDLDLYTNKSGYMHVMSTLALHGYKIYKVYTGYPTGNDQHDTVAEPIGFGVDRVINMRNMHDLSIDIIISADNSPYMPIFNFHSTALMNFISSYGFFSAYPNLTLNRTSVVNPLGFPGQDTPTDRIQSCIQKYEERGFTFFYTHTSPPLCRLIGCFSPSCIDPIRHIQDKQCLYLPFGNGGGEASSCNNRTYARAYNIKWCLGAKSCDSGVEDAYPFARVSRRL